MDRADRLERAGRVLKHHTDRADRGIDRDEPASADLGIERNDLRTAAFGGRRRGAATAG